MSLAWLTGPIWDRFRKLQTQKPAFSARAVAPAQQAIGAVPVQVAAQGANQNQNGQASGQNAANGGQGEPDSDANAAE